jgi:uncharacterized protein YjbJ (UPF0337 family)
MKSSTKDKVKGNYHEAKGKVKEMAGKITDNPKLEAEGTGEKIAGVSCTGVSLDPRLLWRDTQQS